MSDHWDVISLIAGTPRRISHHNVIGNDERDGSRREIYVAISSEAPNDHHDPWGPFNDYPVAGSRSQARSKQETPQGGEDIVCSLWKHRAGVMTHRVGVASQLDNRFDGDYMNGVRILEGDTARIYEMAMHPRHTQFNANAPGITNTIKFDMYSVVNAFLEQETTHAT